jgi:putative spermidine/putrescine transport system permease protein
MMATLLSRSRSPASVPGWLAALAAAVLIYLTFPIFVIVPVSFSSGTYLSFPPPGWSLRWYANFFQRPEWQSATWLSIWVAASVTLLACALGTPAAFGLVRGRFPGKRLLNGFVLSPIIVPGIIVAVGIYFVYARLGLIGHPIGLVLAHTCLAVPFVVINVSAALYGFDERLEQAALNLGATPWRAFWLVTFPLIRPGLLAGAVFAFITSFDELLVALFVSGTTAMTLPRLMWQEVRQDIDPTIAAASALLLALTTALLVSVEILRRRGERLRNG